MSLYIFTTGTSIAGGPIHSGESVVEFRARIDARLHEIRNAERTTENFLKRASAETHGLIRAGAASNDEVVFLLSATEDGRACGERLAAITAAEMKCQARIREVEGLQVSDAQLFRRTGVNSLFDGIEDLAKDRSPDEVHLNATGGYKGIVPYVVLYAMFRGISVSYMYEFSDSLITLPPLPLEFDWERLMPAAQVIEEVSRAGAVDEATWRGLLPFDYATNRDRYDTLFEFDDGLVTLSVVGMLISRRLREVEEQADVLLSPNAHRAFEASTSDARSHFEFVLDRIRSPLHRAGYKHSETLRKTDLKVWKVYATSGPRVLYWVDAGRVYVGEIIAQHDDYEAYVSGKPMRRTDYDLKQFIRLEPENTQDYEKIRDHIQTLSEEPANRARALEEEMKSLRLDAQKARTERNAIRKSMHQHARDAAEHAAKKAELEVRNSLDQAYGEKLRAKNDQIAKLEALVEDLRRDLADVSDQMFEEQHGR